MSKRDRLFAARDRLAVAAREWMKRAEAATDEDAQAWMATWAIACEQKASEVTQRLMRERTWRDDPTRF